MKRIIRNIEGFNALLVQIPHGRHQTTELFQHLRRSFPRSSDPKPVVLLGLVAIISTSDDLPRETLEVVGALVVRGVLYGVLCFELLQHEVGKAIDTVEDPECHKGLHHVQIELREVDIQVQQSLPKERVKGQLEPLKEIVFVYGHMAGGRPSSLVGWPREPKLHKIRDLIEFPD